MPSRWWFAACVAVVVSSGCGRRGDVIVEAVSTQSYLVTGGDVLVRVRPNPGTDLATVTVRLNDVDVTRAFRPESAGQVLLGVVDGLRLGENVLDAQASGSTGRLVVTNYPITGPIISGPHEQPYVCETASFRLVTGAMLGDPIDDYCSVETRVDYIYRTNEGEYKPLPDGPRPADLIQTVTTDGRTVPFIVRVQTGTVNRAVYQSSLLHDPNDPMPTPWERSAGWNGRLVYTHGGGCQGGWNRQGTFTGSVLEPGLLGAGYALTSSSLNVFGTNCSDLLASETHIMVKERFIETYGVPRYTVAIGGSGGAYQSHQTADNYPGVFDGIIVSASFPDVLSATAFTVADARLLHHYFTRLAPGRFTSDEQAAVAGFRTGAAVAAMSVPAARIDPVHKDGAAPDAQGGQVGTRALEPLRYHPTLNPKGFRPSIYDHAGNVFGRDPKTGAAGRPLDNVGVQYGLEALNTGAITVEQFLDLNARIGGFDTDANHVPERHAADPHAARMARQTGRILFGGGGLATTPVIDYRSYTDDNPRGDIHMTVHQYSTRARLQAANGHAGNHVMQIGGRWGYTEESPDLKALFAHMDTWLTNVASDTSADTLATKVARAKPAELVEGCWDNRSQPRTFIADPLEYKGSGPCQGIYPAFSTPRHVAGAPLANDIVACQLKPIDEDDYRVAFAAEQLSRLEQMFPDGVCDWTKPDRYGEGFQGTWRSFGPSPVNRVE